MSHERTFESKFNSNYKVNFKFEKIWLSRKNSNMDCKRTHENRIGARQYSVQLLVMQKRNPNELRNLQNFLYVQQTLASSTKIRQFQRSVFIWSSKNSQNIFRYHAHTETTSPTQDLWYDQLFDLQRSPPKPVQL